MKNWIFIICLTVLLKPVVPVLDYVVNYDYIRTELCVNKAKPQLHCNGKCFLMKQMAAAAESEKPASSDKKHAAVMETSDLFFAEITAHGFFFFDGHGNASELPAYQNLYAHLNKIQLLRPPIFIS